jgi:hypothetical protein
VKNRDKYKYEKEGRKKGNKNQTEQEEKIINIETQKR